MPRPALPALALVAALAGCAGTAPPAAPADRPEIADAPRTVLVYDAGPDDDEGRTTLHADVLPFEWTTAPTGSFTAASKVLPSRDGLTDSGVLAPERLALTADVAPGAWRVRFWLGGVLEGTPPEAFGFRVDGEPVALDWTMTHPPAEPKAPPGVFVRAHASTVTAGRGGLALAWEAPADTVRLLAVTLTPVAEARSPAEAGVLGMLRDLDRPETWAFSLGQTAALTRAAAEREPESPFLALWADRVALLHRAEYDLWTLRGYEANIDSTGLSLIDRNVQTVYWLDALLTDLAPGDPLYDRALWDRMRAVRWLQTEVNGRGDLDRDERDLDDLRQRHDSDLLRMYAGEQIDTADACDAVAPGGAAFEAAAPAWASKQREALCRISDVAAWWLANRQAPNGELGGKLGDDVEVLRQWLPVALAGDAAVQGAWRALADVVWDSPKIVDGYFREPLDVEHASEPIADAQPQLLLWPGHEAVGRERAAPSARHMRETWTETVGPDVEGNARRHFRSAWFGTTDVDERPPRNRDLAMNARAARAVRYYAWATGDEDAVATLHEWARAWRDAAFRTDKGKPAGVYPVSMRSSDLALNGDEPTWYVADMFWPYFEWTRSQSAELYDTSVFVWSLTRDTTVLAPMHASLDLVRRHAGGGAAVPGGAEHAPGSTPWAADHLLDAGALWEAAGAWRLATGDRRHDGLLRRYGSPYTRARLADDPAEMEPVLDDILGVTRYNAPLLRGENLYTDRIYVSSGLGLGPSGLAAMLTGGLSTESPSFGVTWTATPPDLARYVADAGPGRLAVRLHAFGGPAEATARLWGLDAGAYTVRVAAGGAVHHEARVEVAERGQAVRVPVPAGASTLTVTAR